MKIGDKVRFLSDIGGGVVAGFQGNDIVLVEDADGFQIPTAISEVVVVDVDDYSTSRVVEKKMKYRPRQRQHKRKYSMTTRTTIRQTALLHSDLRLKSVREVTS